MSLLALDGVTQRLRDRVLLDGIELRLEAGTRLGLIGANGSGKTTLLRILTGELTPDEGQRAARRGLRIGVLEQSPRLAPAATLRASLRAGLDLELPDHAVDHELGRFGLDDPERAPGSLSEGELRRAALARLFLARPELLLLDEPTNQLDLFAARVLEERLEQCDLPFVLVTHDRWFLERVVGAIVELERGQLFVYPGSYGDYLEARSERLVVEERAASERAALFLRETEWMRRGAPARTTKAKARITRYEGLSSQMTTARARTLAFELPSGPRLGARVLRLSGVELASGGTSYVRGLDFELAPGERVALVGPNGAGKSLFLAACAGRVAPARGTLELGETVRLATLDAQRPGLDPEQSVARELAGSSDQVLVGGNVVRVESYLDRFLFHGVAQQALTKSLSGGERVRLLLAKLVLAGGNVLLLDEPTQDLDLATLRTLEEAILAFPGSVLVASHDRWFLDRVATRVLYLDGRGGARQAHGDVSLLLETLERERREREAASPAERGSERTRRDDTPRKAKGLAPWEQRELDELLARIPKEEAALTALDADLASPELYTQRRAELPALQRRRTDLGAQLEQLYARWQELEEKRG